MTDAARATLSNRAPIIACASVRDSSKKRQSSVKDSDTETIYLSRSVPSGEVFDETTQTLREAAHLALWNIKEKSERRGRVPVKRRAR